MTYLIPEFERIVHAANVDIAPTVARILALNIPGSQGRALEEALEGRATGHEIRGLGKESTGPQKRAA